MIIITIILLIIPILILLYHYILYILFYILLVCLFLDGKAKIEVTPYAAIIIIIVIIIAILLLLLVMMFMFYSQPSASIFNLWKSVRTSYDEFPLPGIDMTQPNSLK